MYRTKLVCLDKDLQSVINIRVKLLEYEPSKSLRKILRRNDAQYRTVIRRAVIDADKERLYRMHRERFDGFIYSSLRYFFYGESNIPSPFDTYEVCVYDGDRLIAASFFDLGEYGVAGLLALYDTDYNKDSLGIYTMLKEVEYTQNQGFKYYYPGYILDKNTTFDYKLRLGFMQYFNWETGRWRKWQSREGVHSTAAVYTQKLQSIQSTLDAVGIESRLFLNPYFSIGYTNSDYARGAAFVACFTRETDVRYIVEYWPEEDQFVLSEVSISAFDYNSEVVKISKSYLNDHNFQHLLTYDRHILQSDQADSIVFAVRLGQFEAFDEE